MELYYSFSILIVIATVFYYLNLRFLKLPATIGRYYGYSHGVINSIGFYR